MNVKRVLKKEQVAVPNSLHLTGSQNHFGPRAVICPLVAGGSVLKDESQPSCESDSGLVKMKFLLSSWTYNNPGLVL